jgi:hypothetical protein
VISLNKFSLIVVRRMVSSGKLRRVAPHGITSQNTPFFIVTAVKTSNLTIALGLAFKKAIILRKSNT